MPSPAEATEAMDAPADGAVRGWLLIATPGALGVVAGLGAWVMSSGLHPDDQGYPRVLATVLLVLGVWNIVADLRARAVDGAVDEEYGKLALGRVISFTLLVARVYLVGDAAGVLPSECGRGRRRDGDHGRSAALAAHRLPGGIAGPRIRAVLAAVGRAAAVGEGILDAGTTSPRGLEMLMQPGPLLWLVFGVVVGFLVGVLPGLSTSNTAALLLPFAITLPLENSLVLIVSIYAGAAFGGAVPAILFNVPGETGSAVTALDGYPMAKKGQAGLAIGIARMASVAGGVISGVVVLLLLQPLGALSLKFGAREMFVIILLGLVVASTLMGGSARKGLMVGVLGLLLAIVGVSPGTAETRFTFGELQLYDGIPFLAALIGTFAISEMLMIVGSDTMQKLQRDQEVKSGGLRKESRDAIAGVKATLAEPGAVLPLQRYRHRARIDPWHRYHGVTLHRLRGGEEKVEDPGRIRQGQSQGHHRLGGV